MQSRDRAIVRTSIIGIIANIFLAAFKAFLGLLSNSIAIVMDAVNNISDAASSVITIVGTKLAGKQPDKKHPFGHGRVEYLTAMVISVIVLYAGITAFIESVKKIFNPVTPDYSTLTLIIIGVAVVVKIILGLYVRSVGIKVNSDSLVNSGKDAMLDSIISASTLVAAAIFLIFGLSLEAYLGAIIALVIIKSGIEMLRGAISQILGERADSELAGKIKETVLSFPEVSGAYDLVLHNYGPDTFNGSIHIEVPDTIPADKLDDLLRKITVKVYMENNVILTAIGVYSLNTKDPEAATAREKVKEIALSFKDVIQMHGFYFDREEKRIRFDLVIGFSAENRRELFNNVCEAVQKEYPDYKIEAAMDTDFNES
ncbi:MAG: cation transporter [Clostridia bacterium]|nr:cation transporter [Clostridia bacterium]